MLVSVVINLAAIGPMAHRSQGRDLHFDAAFEPTFGPRFS